MIEVNDGVIFFVGVVLLLAGLVFGSIGVGLLTEGGAVAFLIYCVGVGASLGAGSAMIRCSSKEIKENKK